MSVNKIKLILVLKIEIQYHYEIMVEFPLILRL